MTRTETRLIALVERELGIPPGRIGLQSRLADHGDSLDAVNLLAAVEAMFDIRISSAQSDALETVGDLLCLVVAEPALV